MALIVCPDCRSQISSDAAACPRCGRKRPRTLAESAVTIVVGVALCLLVLGYLLIHGVLALPKE